MENTKSIGICPICGQGHITEHPFGWACDNSSTWAYRPVLELV